MAASAPASSSDQTRPPFLEPLGLSPMHQGRVQIPPIDIPWEDGASIYELSQEPDKYEILLLVHKLFQQAIQEQKLWNLNASNVYFKNRILTLFNSVPLAQFDEETLFQMAETYHCVRGDEIFSFILQKA